MSFSTELKEELSKIENLTNKEELKYELIGYLMSSNITKIYDKIRFSTENEYNINRFARILSNLKIEDYDISIQGKTFYIITSKDSIDKVISEEFNDKDKMKFIVKGAYLGSGSINNPENKYHLEIDFGAEKNAKYIMEILENYHIKSNLVIKKNQFVIYIKDGEEISKILALMGANKSVLKFEEIRVQREMNNKINRIVNCESANLNKTINASIEQIEAIKKLKSSGEFAKLDDSLKEIAELRIKNPNMSLIELGQNLKDPIGKSGVNYRFKKIMEMAKNM